MRTSTRLFEKEYSGEISRKLDFVPPAAIAAGYEVPDTSRVKTYYVVKNYRGHFKHDVIQLRSRLVYCNKNNIIYLFMTFEMFYSLRGESPPPPRVLFFLQYRRVGTAL